MKRIGRSSPLLQAGFAALCFSTVGASAEPIIGLGSLTNSLVFFDSATPGTVSAPLPVTGLGAEFLLGIDLRPADGQLIGVTRSTANPTQAQAYSINTTTGAATLIQAAFTFPFTSIGAIGIDFNPVPNALRLVSDAEANLRITAGGTGTVNTDSSLTRTGSPDPTLDIAGVAYSNNFAGASVTTLYDINANTGQLFTQGGVNGTPSPNTGMLFLVGSLGLVPANNLVGFDISGLTGIAYASMFVPGGSDALFTINQATGAATLVGAIGGNLDIIDITAATQGRVPEPGTLALFGIGTALLGALRRRRA
jgi:hypothetical protein